MPLPSEINWGTLGAENATAYFNDPDVLGLAP